MAAPEELTLKSDFKRAKNFSFLTMRRVKNFDDEGNWYRRAIQALSYDTEYSSGVTDSVHHMPEARMQLVIHRFFFYGAGELK